MRDAARSRWWAVLALALLAPLTACGEGLDESRATACRRAVPAIVPEGTTASILRVGADASPHGVRVDYRLNGRPDARARWIVCAFAPGTGLVAITTESGPVSGASVYLLRRHYLDTPEAAAADPGGR